MYMARWLGTIYYGMQWAPQTISDRHLLQGPNIAGLVARAPLAAATQRLSRLTTFTTFPILTSVLSAHRQGLGLAPMCLGLY